ncbi:hypothetical protein [Streptomyces sp. KL116D]|uniref:hypothetical protein n=1 Tax=Streptomyces sp. KL116D TaxID=3045152 RepID=UPI0035563881
MLIVGLDGTRWLVDIGFGASPWSPSSSWTAPAATPVRGRCLLRRQVITHGARRAGRSSSAGRGEKPDGWTVRQVVTETAVPHRLHPRKAAPSPPTTALRASLHPAADD